MKKQADPRDELISLLEKAKAEKAAEIERLRQSIAEKNARIKELEERKIIREILRGNMMKDLHK